MADQAQDELVEDELVEGELVDDDLPASEAELLEDLAQQMVGEKKAPSRRGGKKTLFKHQFTQLAVNYAKLGATNPQMAEYLGVGLSTFERWLKVNPEFGKRVRAAKVRANSTVADSLYHRAKGYETTETHVSSYNGNITLTEIPKRYPPDPTSMIFFLKNRDPENWRDKKDHEMTGNISVSKLLDDIDGSDTGLPTPIKDD